MATDRTTRRTSPWLTTRPQTGQSKRTSAFGPFTLASLLVLASLAPREALAQQRVEVLAVAGAGAAVGASLAEALTPPAHPAAPDEAAVSPLWHPTQPLATRLATARAASEGVSSGRLPSDGTAVDTGFAAAVVARPVAEVSQAIHDVARYREVIPQVVQSQQLRRTARTQDVFVRISVPPLPEMWARLRYREALSPDGALEIDGTAVDGNLERMSLRWRLTPAGDGRHTLVEFWALVVPSLPIPLPPALLTREQVRTAQRGVAALRARFESADAALSAGGAAHLRGARRRRP